MEGPTPVSALIPAATMVTAGIFLLIRVSFFIEKSEFLLLIILIIGSLTSIFAGSVGIFQNDIKKLIAYSTCSQLGYMFLTCGLAFFSLSLFHLFNHAFFKAMLFLGSGSIIHALSDEQDMRRYSFLNILNPILNILFLLSSLSLIGFFYFSGFYSKDVVLENIFINKTWISLWSY
jgi:NADH-ubiquinone oxidoreductase chain 5